MRQKHEIDYKSFRGTHNFRASDLALQQVRPFDEHCRKIFVVRTQRPFLNFDGSDVEKICLFMLVLRGENMFLVEKAKLQLCGKSTISIAAPRCAPHDISVPVYFNLFRVLAH